MSNPHSTFEVVGRKIAVDRLQLIFATGIAAWVSWFCWDAWHASARIENLILILPVSMAAIVLYLLVAASCIKPVDSAASEDAAPAMSHRSMVRIAGSIVLFVAFVIAGPWIGFDVATFAYLLVMLLFLGERRRSVLLIFPLLFTVAVIYCFGTLLAAPLPVLLLKGLNP